MPVRSEKLKDKVCLNMGADMKEQAGHILIAGPPYRGYLGMIERAFKERGLRVSVLEWQYPERNLLQEYWYYASGNYRSRLADIQNVMNTAAIEKAVERLSPDFLLVMKNASLSAKTKELCDARGAKRALWAYDSAREYPQIAKAAADYDIIYTYEPNDLDLLSSIGEAKYLPMAYDPGLYFPKDVGTNKEYDISFIGSLRDTPVRKETLRFVAGELPGSTVGVWTDSIHWYSHRRLKDLRFTTGRPNIRLTRRTVGHSEINSIYASSKICLNIHHPQSIGALNPRSFEILGSGGLLLTDRKMEGLYGLEDGVACVYYSSREDLVGKIRRLTESDDERRRIAEKGHQAALRAHTFKHRASKIMDDLR
jgi:spore maturation protein CgeB